MRRRLVFGAGYLGRRVVQRWLDAGDDVTVVTRSQDSAARWTSIGASSVVANVTDLGSMRRAFDSDDRTFHSVLYAVGYDRTSGEDRNEVAIEGPKRVVDVLGDRLEHLTFTSSTSVYGQQDGELVDETSPTAPATDSGRRCVEAEEAVREAVGGTPLTILRLAGLYGPERVLARAEALQSRTPFPGNGEQWLNLIHVEDAAAACIAASEQQANDLFLVSDDLPVRRAEYYGHLADLLEAPPPEFDGQPRVSRGASNKRCSNRRLKETLVDELRYPTFRDGLSKSL